MNKKAFERAKDDLRVAQQKLERIRAAGSLDALAVEWSDFLVQSQRVFTRLRKAAEAGPSKGWCDKLFETRRKDELLSYIQHARNADEHGIERVTEQMPASLGIRSSGSTLIQKLVVRDGEVVEAKVHGSPLIFDRNPASVTLVSVKDRGVTYTPPRTHLGKVIEDPTLLKVAELAYGFLEKALHEAAKFLL